MIKTNIKVDNLYFAGECIECGSPKFSEVPQRAVLVEGRTNLKGKFAQILRWLYDHDIEFEKIEMININKTYTVRI